MSNIEWDRREVLIALDVYFRHGRQHLSKGHPALSRLSQELQQIASKVHPEDDIPDSFRNLNGMHWKFGGYSTIDPQTSTSGVHYSELERSVFQEFLEDQPGMHLEALETREALGLGSPRNRWWADQPGEKFWLELTNRGDLGTDLRAPRYDEGGSENWRYTLLLDVQPGDFIYHYHKDDQAVVARSVAQSWAQDHPIVWAARGTYARDANVEPHKRPGLKVELSNFQELDRPLTLEELRERSDELEQIHQDLQETYQGSLYLPFAFSSTGVRPNQAYALKFPAAYVNQFSQLQEGPHPQISTSGQHLATGGQAPSSKGSSNRNAEENDQQEREGQGFTSTAEERKAIEMAAMRAAKQYFSTRGFDVEDTSATQPFDLLCTKEEKTVYVEVKGTTTDGSSIILTRGEVEHARKHKNSTALFVVSGMTLRNTANGLVGEGGERSVFYPWNVKVGDLTPIQYEYRIQPT